METSIDVYDTVPEWISDQSTAPEKLYFDYVSSYGGKVEAVYCGNLPAIELTTTFTFTFPLELS